MLVFILSGPKLKKKNCVYSICTQLACTHHSETHNDIRITERWQTVRGRFAVGALKFLLTASPA